MLQGGRNTAHGGKNTNYNFNGKNIRIPDEEINRSMKTLHLTKDEAIELYLEDEGYVENEVVEELTTKAKENKTVQHDAKATKPRKTSTKPRERKPDEEKEFLIELIENSLKNAGIDAKITNKTKIIEFDYKNQHYKLDLIRQRPPK